MQIPTLIGETPAIQRLKEDIAAAARCDAKVLITGESGAGKEITARLIHEQSARRCGPYLAINCAAIADTLLESELFGHVRGSFTDAWRDRMGLLDAAHGGTLLMDEIGDMSLRMQGLLLRFVETGELQRVGEDRVLRRRDVRVIAATNANLQDSIGAGRFRSDLFYRLNVISIVVPPLRDRRDDIPILVDAFIRAESQAHRLAPPMVTPEAMSRLAEYSWGGNVRELRNVIERLVLRRPGQTIGVGDLPTEIAQSNALGSTPFSIERARTPDALLDRMLTERMSFWSAVYDPFMAHDLTRDDVMRLVRVGLERSRGSMPLLVQLFNMDMSELDRFLRFLRKYQCLFPQHRAVLRTAPPRRKPRTSNTGFPQAV
jgi:transcriptional regulator with PAS, ATPase and Fis domain